LITIEIKDKIRKLAHQTSDEICGFVVKNNLIPCENISSNPTKHFQISPVDYMVTCQIGNPDYLYHSHHNNEEFSDLDKITLYNHKIRGLLYCKKNNKFKIFLPESYQNKYIDRSFKIGQNDCLSLVTEYYKNELGVELPAFDRTENWYTENPNRINENIPVRLIKVAEAQKNDIIVFDLLNNKMPSHIAIYLGNDMILHQPRGRQSTIELLNNALKNKIAYILRWN